MTLSPERQSARMSKSTNDGLARSGTGCFIAVQLYQCGSSGRQMVEQWRQPCFKISVTTCNHKLKIDIVNVRQSPSSTKLPVSTRNKPLATDVFQLVSEEVTTFVRSSINRVNHRRRHDM